MERLLEDLVSGNRGWRPLTTRQKGLLDEELSRLGLGGISQEKRNAVSLSDLASMMLSIARLISRQNLSRPIPPERARSILIELSTRVVLHDLNHGSLAVGFLSEAEQSDRPDLLRSASELSDEVREIRRVLGFLDSYNEALLSQIYGWIKEHLQKQKRLLETYSQIAKELRQSGKSKRNFQLFVNETGREMKALIARVEKWEKEGVGSSPSLLDLHDELQSFVNENPNSYGASLSIEPFLEYKRALITAHGFRDLIRNLTNNAAQAQRGDQPVKIHFNITEVERQSKFYALIEIKDDGAGISAENVERIRQGEPFTTKGPMGSEQGLAAVREILQRHGGWLEVDSTLDAGTTFKVFIPNGRQGARLAGARLATPDETTRALLTLYGLDKIPGRAHVLVIVKKGESENLSWIEKQGAWPRLVTDLDFINEGAGISDVVIVKGTLNFTNQVSFRRYDEIVGRFISQLSNSLTNENAVILLLTNHTQSNRENAAFDGHWRYLNEIFERFHLSLKPLGEVEDSVAFVVQRRRGVEAKADPPQPLPALDERMPRPATQGLELVGVGRHSDAAPASATTAPADGRRRSSGGRLAEDGGEMAGAVRKLLGQVSDPHLRGQIAEGLCRVTEGEGHVDVEIGNYHGLTYDGLVLEALKLSLRLSEAGDFFLATVRDVHPLDQGGSVVIRFREKLALPDIGPRIRDYVKYHAAAQKFFWGAFWVGYAPALILGAAMLVTVKFYPEFYKNFLEANYFLPLFSAAVWALSLICVGFFVGKHFLRVSFVSLFYEMSEWTRSVEGIYKKTLRMADECYPEDQTLREEIAGLVDRRRSVISRLLYLIPHEGDEGFLKKDIKALDVRASRAFYDVAQVYENFLGIWNILLRKRIGLLSDESRRNVVEEIFEDRTRLTERTMSVGKGILSRRRLRFDGHKVGIALDQAMGDLGLLAEIISSVDNESSPVLVRAFEGYANRLIVRAEALIDRAERKAGARLPDGQARLANRGRRFFGIKLLLAALLVTATTRPAGAFQVWGARPVQVLVAQVMHAEEGDVDRLSEGIRDTKYDSRLRAVFALGKIKNPDERVFRLLAQALGDKDERVYFAASGELEKKGAAAVPYLIQVLRGQIPGTHTPNAQHQIAVSTLVGVGRPAVRAMIGLLAEPNAQITADAVDVLGRIRDEGTIEALIPMLGHRDSTVRWYAARAIGEFDPGVAVKAVPALCRMLFNDTNHLPKSYAALTLGKIGDVSAVPSLIRALNGEAGFSVRAEAAESLGLLRDVRALSALLKALEPKEGSGYRNLRIKALYALRHVAEVHPEAAPKMVEPLVRVMSETDKVIEFYVQKLAAVVLASLGKEGVEPLIAALENEKLSFLVQDEAAYQLQSGRFKDDPRVQEALREYKLKKKNPSRSGARMALRSFDGAQDRTLSRVEGVRRGPSGLAQGFRGEGPTSPEQVERNETRRGARLAEDAVRERLDPSTTYSSALLVSAANVVLNETPIGGGTSMMNLGDDGPRWFPYNVHVRLMPSDAPPELLVMRVEPGWFHANDKRVVPVKLPDEDVTTLDSFLTALTGKIQEINDKNTRAVYSNNRYRANSDGSDRSVLQAKLERQLAKPDRQPFPYGRLARLGGIPDLLERGGFLSSLPDAGYRKAGEILDVLDALGHTLPGYCQSVFSLLADFIRSGVPAQDNFIELLEWFESTCLPILTYQRSNGKYRRSNTDMYDITQCLSRIFQSEYFARLKERPDKAKVFFELITRIFLVRTWDWGTGRSDTASREAPRILSVLMRRLIAPEFKSLSLEEQDRVIDGFNDLKKAASRLARNILPPGVVYGDAAELPWNGAIPQSYKGTSYGAHPRLVPRNESVAVIDEEQAVALMRDPRPGARGILVESYDEMTYLSLHLVLALVHAAEEQFNFGLATGGTTESLRKALGLWNLIGQAFPGQFTLKAFDKAKRWTTLDDYFWPPMDGEKMVTDPQVYALSSYREEQLYMMLVNLLGRKFPIEHIKGQFLSPPVFVSPWVDSSVNYVRLMAIFMEAAERILLQLHGVGTTGHDAFNDPFLLPSPDLRRGDPAKHFPGLRIPDSLERVPQSLRVLRPDHLTQVVEATQVQNRGHFGPAFHPFFLRFMGDSGIAHLLDLIEILAGMLEEITFDKLAGHYPETKYQFASLEHFQEAFQYALDNYDVTPRYAFTQGTGDIMLRTNNPDSVNLFMVAGPHKAEALRRSWAMPPNSSATASWMHLAQNAVLVVADEAAGRIDPRHFFRLSPGNPHRAFIEEGNIERRWGQTRQGREINRLLKEARRHASPASAARLASLENKMPAKESDWKPVTYGLWKFSRYGIFLPWLFVLGGLLFSYPYKILQLGTSIGFSPMFSFVNYIYYLLNYRSFGVFVDSFLRFIFENKREQITGFIVGAVKKARDERPPRSNFRDELSIKHGPYLMTIGICKTSETWTIRLSVTRKDGQPFSSQEIERFEAYNIFFHERRFSGYQSPKTMFRPNDRRSLMLVREFRDLELKDGMRPVLIAEKLRTYKAARLAGEETEVSRQKTVVSEGRENPSAARLAGKMQSKKDLTPLAEQHGPRTADPMVVRESNLVREAMSILSHWESVSPTGFVQVFYSDKGNDVFIDSIYLPTLRDGKQTTNITNHLDRMITERLPAGSFDQRFTLTVDHVHGRIVIEPFKPSSESAARLSDNAYTDAELTKAGIESVEADFKGRRLTVKVNPRGPGRDSPFQVVVEGATGGYHPYALAKAIAGNFLDLKETAGVSLQERFERAISTVLTDPTVSKIGRIVSFGTAVKRAPMNPSVRIRLGRMQKGPGVLMNTASLTGESRLPKHKHHVGQRKHPEFYYIREGKGVVHIGRRSIEVEAGDFFMIPAGAMHSITSTGDGDLHLIFMTSLPYVRRKNNAAKVRSERDGRTTREDLGIVRVADKKEPLFRQILEGDLEFRRYFYEDGATEQSFEARPDETQIFVGEGQGGVYLKTDGYPSIFLRKGDSISIPPRTAFSISGSSGSMALVVNARADEITRVFSRDSQFVVILYNDGSLAAFNLNTGEEAPVLRTSKNVESFDISPDSRFVVVWYTADYSLDIFNLKTGQKIGNPIPDVHSFRISPDSKFIVIHGWPGESLNVFDLSTGEKIAGLEAKTVYSYKISQDSRLVVIRDWNGSLSAFDLETRQTIPDFKISGEKSDDELLPSALVSYPNPLRSHSDISAARLAGGRVVGGNRWAVIRGRQKNERDPAQAEQERVPILFGERRKEFKLLLIALLIRSGVDEDFIAESVITVDGPAQTDTIRDNNQIMHKIRTYLQTRGRPDAPAFGPVRSVNWFAQNEENLDAGLSEAVALSGKHGKNYEAEKESILRILATRRATPSAGSGQGARLADGQARLAGFTAGDTSKMLEFARGVPQEYHDAVLTEADGEWRVCISYPPNTNTEDLQAINKRLDKIRRLFTDKDYNCSFIQTGNPSSADRYRYFSISPNAAPASATTDPADGRQRPSGGRLAGEETGVSGQKTVVSEGRENPSAARLAGNMQSKKDLTPLTQLSGDGNQAGREGWNCGRINANAGVSAGTAQWLSRWIEPARSRWQLLVRTFYFSFGLLSERVMPKAKNITVAATNRALCQPDSILPNIPPSAAAIKNAWNSVREVLPTASSLFSVQKFFVSIAESITHPFIFGNNPVALAARLAGNMQSKKDLTPLTLMVEVYREFEKPGKPSMPAPAARLAGARQFLPLPEAGGVILSNLPQDEQAKGVKYGALPRDAGIAVVELEEGDSAPFFGEVIGEFEKLAYKNTVRHFSLEDLSNNLNGFDPRILIVPNDGFNKPEERFVRRAVQEYVNRARRPVEVIFYESVPPRIANPVNAYIPFGKGQEDLEKALSALRAHLTQLFRTGYEAVLKWLAKYGASMGKIRGLLEDSAGHANPVTVMHYDAEGNATPVTPEQAKNILGKISRAYPLVILSPHPDDDVIALAGLILNSLRAGISVQNWVAGAGDSGVARLSDDQVAAAIGYLKSLNEEEARAFWERIQREHGVYRRVISELDLEKLPGDARRDFETRYTTFGEVENLKLEVSHWTAGKEMSVGLEQVARRVIRRLEVEKASSILSEGMPKPLEVKWLDLLLPAYAHRVGGPPEWLWDEEYPTALGIARAYFKANRYAILTAKARGTPFIYILPHEEDSHPHHRTTTKLFRRAFLEAGKEVGLDSEKDMIEIDYLAPWAGGYNTYFFTNRTPGASDYFQAAIEYGFAIAVLIGELTADRFGLPSPKVEAMSGLKGNVWAQRGRREIFTPEIPGARLAGLAAQLPHVVVIGDARSTEKEMAALSGQYHVDSFDTVPAFLKSDGNPPDLVIAVYSGSNPTVLLEILTSLQEAHIDKSRILIVSGYTDTLGRAEQKGIAAIEQREMRSFENPEYPGRFLREVNRLIESAARTALTSEAQWLRGELQPLLARCQEEGLDYAVVSMRVGESVIFAGEATEEIEQIHRAIYEKNKKVQFIVQSRPAAAQALLAKRFDENEWNAPETLLPLVTPDHIALPKERGPLLLVDEDPKIAEAMTGHTVVMTTRHGLIAVGTNSREALFRAMVEVDSIRTRMVSEILGRPTGLSEEEANDLLGSPIELDRQAELEGKPVETKAEVMDLGENLASDHAIASAREVLTAVGRQIAQKRLVVGPGGNTSVRVRLQTSNGERDIILIKASGKAFEDMRPEEYVGVDLEAGHRVKGLGENLKPSSETAFHLAIYRARRDAQAVVHVHSPVATGFASSGNVGHTFRLREGEEPIVSIHYTFPGDPLAAEVGKKIVRVNELLLANHGTINVGVGFAGFPGEALRRAFNDAVEMETRAIQIFTETTSGSSAARLADSNRMWLAGFIASGMAVGALFGLIFENILLGLASGLVLGLIVYFISSPVSDSSQGARLSARSNASKGGISPVGLPQNPLPFDRWQAGDIVEVTTVGTFTGRKIVNRGQILRRLKRRINGALVDVVMVSGSLGIYSESDCERGFIRFIARPEESAGARLALRRGPSGLAQGFRGEGPTSPEQVERNETRRGLSRAQSRGARMATRIRGVVVRIYHWFGDLQTRDSFNRGLPIYFDSFVKQQANRKSQTPHAGAWEGEDTNDYAALALGMLDKIPAGSKRRLRLTDDFLKAYNAFFDTGNFANEDLLRDIFKNLENFKNPLAEPLLNVARKYNIGGVNKPRAQIQPDERRARPAAARLAGDGPETQRILMGRDEAVELLNNAVSEADRNYSLFAQSPSTMAKAQAPVYQQTARFLRSLASEAAGWESVPDTLRDWIERAGQNPIARDILSGLLSKRQELLALKLKAIEEAFDAAGADSRLVLRDTRTDEEYRIVKIPSARYLWTFGLRLFAENHFYGDGSNLVLTTEAPRGARLAEGQSIQAELLEKRPEVTSPDDRYLRFKLAPHAVNGKKSPGTLAHVRFILEHGGLFPEWAGRMIRAEIRKVADEVRGAHSEEGYRTRVSSIITGLDNGPQSYNYVDLWVFGPKKSSSAVRAARLAVTDSARKERRILAGSDPKFATSVSQKIIDQINDQSLLQFTVLVYDAQRKTGLIALDGRVLEIRLSEDGSLFVLGTGGAAVRIERKDYPFLLYQARHQASSTATAQIPSGIQISQADLKEALGAELMRIDRFTAAHEDLSKMAGAAELNVDDFYTRESSPYMTAMLAYTIVFESRRDPLARFVLRGDSARVEAIKKMTTGLGAAEAILDQAPRGMSPVKITDVNRPFAPRAGERYFYVNLKSPGLPNLNFILRAALTESRFAASDMAASNPVFVEWARAAGFPVNNLPQLLLVILGQTNDPRIIALYLYLPRPVPVGAQMRAFAFAARMAAQAV
ncbi:MAG: class II aldolase/adducin family protein [Candidatus Omnitrophica bacterium]|nr:class II aldolase/adducin family protein [Candidatus Omnitrophota bacterium]